MGSYLCIFFGGFEVRAHDEPRPPRATLQTVDVKTPKNVFFLTSNL